METFSQGGRLFRIAIACVVAHFTSSALAAEPRVTTFRVEHLDQFDPEALRDFDIPRLPVDDAIRAFAQSIRGTYSSRLSGNDFAEELLGGSISGVPCAPP